MTKVSVELGDLKEIVMFVNILNKYDYECDLHCGSYYVDAKSLLGVITLHNASDVELIIHADKTDELLKNIEQYCSWKNINRIFKS